MPRNFENDEQRSFAASLLTFDPYGHQPPPPAYPVYVAAGKLLFFFVRRQLLSLLILNVACAVAGFVLFALSGRGWIWILGAFAIYISPPVRFLCSRPSPEPVALFLFAFAFFVIRRGLKPAALPAEAGGPLLLALSVGCAPQIFFGVTAFVLVSRIRKWPYFLVLILCFIPVLQNIGFDRFPLYFATLGFGHGAPIRDFLLQPWWKATPLVLIGALFGARRDWPLAAYTIAALTCAATLGASNESVRPYVPALAGIALLAASAYHGRRGEADDLAHRADVQRGAEH